MSQVKTEMVPVPLPTEIPPPPRLDQLPLDILHSASVEMLIQQNEDLSARLKVNIRRNSELERQIIENDKKINHLKRQKENLKAQVEIVNEKEAIWSSQKQDKDRKLESMEKEVDLLQLRYHELHTTNKARERETQQRLSNKQREIEALQNKLKVFKRVRIRAKEKLRELLIDMASGIYTSEKHIRKSESSQRLLQKNFLLLKQDIEEKQNFFQDQFQQLKDVSKKKIMELEEALDQALEKQRLLNEQKSTLIKELEEIRANLHEERKNRNKVSLLNDEINNLRNETIRLKRLCSELEEKQQLSMDAKKSEIDKLQEENNQLSLQLKEEKALVSRCEQKLLEVSRDNKELSHQLDSIQKLWTTTQERLEKAEIKNVSLVKINKELSRQSKDEQIKRATTESPASTDSNEKDVDHFQKVYASQFRSIARNTELDQ